MLGKSGFRKALQSPGRGKHGITQFQTVSSAVLITIVFVLFSGCDRHTKTDVSDVNESVFRKDNHNPVLTPLTAEVKGKRVRFVHPGTTVTVRAHASDVDGDRLRYRWIAAPESGKVEPIKASSVKWNVGTGKGDKRLYVVVVDGKGGSAKGELRLPTRSEVSFSGQVVSSKGKPINAASVDVNGETTVADSEGFFKLPIEKGNAPRFVLNIRKQGFGLVSKIYDQGIRDGKWTMTEATTQTFDPTQAIVIRDVLSQTNCTGSLTSGINWNNFPQQRIPRVIDTFGQLSSGTIPNEITQALNIIFGGTECNPGISISIPPNSIVDTAGNPPREKVDVSVSTVDLYAPDSMPGDYSVRTKERTMWMQSYGAGAVNIQSGEKSYQLKKGTPAELTIPVDPTQLKMRGKIPVTMPLLVYDEKNGEWRLRGEAKLNKEGNAYLAKIDHLSAFNTDLIKTDQACVRFKGDTLFNIDGEFGKYKLDVIIPMDEAAPVVRSWNVEPDPARGAQQHLHVVANLPNNTWITFLPMRDEPGGLVPYGIFVINSGPAQDPSEPNIPVFPYTACENEIALIEGGGTESNVTLSGGGTSSGYPAIQATGDENGRIYVAWEERFGSGSDPNIYFRTAPMVTSTFGSTINLGPAFFSWVWGKVEIDASDSNVYVTYAHWPSGSLSNIYLAKSTDSGSTFASAINVSGTSSVDSKYQEATIVGNDIFICWLEDENIASARQVLCKGSADNFATLEIAATDVSESGPKVITNGNDVYVSYCDNNGVSYVRKRSASTGSFDAAQRLTSATSSSNCGTERLAISGTKTFALWSEYEGAGQSMKVKMSDNGAAFSDYSVLSILGQVEPGNVNFAAEANSLYVAYIGGSSTNPQAYFTRDINGGGFDTPQTLHGISINDPQDLRLAVDSGMIHVTWMQDPSIYHRFSTDNGYSFHGPFVIASTSPGQAVLTPDMQARSIDRYIVWRQGNSIRYYSWRRD